MEGGAIEFIGIATVFAMVVTKSVDVLRNVLTPLTRGRIPKASWNALSLALGLAMALTWDINMLDNYSDPTSAVQGSFGQVLTGLAIGGAASGYHELFDVLSSTAKRQRAATVEAVSGISSTPSEEAALRERENLS